MEREFRGLNNRKDSRLLLGPYDGYFMFGFVLERDPSFKRRKEGVFGRKSPVGSSLFFPGAVQYGYNVTKFF